MGESWEISGVPGNESIVADGEMKGKSLNEVVAELKDSFLGKENYQRFGNEFPLLIKFMTPTPTSPFRYTPTTR